MSSKFFQLKSFFTYWLDAVDEHSLHSPFFFNFYSNILKKEFAHPHLASLEQIRSDLKQDTRIINVTDFGAGASHVKTTRKIRTIARTSSTPAKYSRLYSRIINHFNCKEILELGTSLGINTMYLAKSHDLAHVTTFEGSPVTSKIAKALFDASKAHNIRIIEGNISDQLPQYLSAIENIDFALMDANHRFKPTIQYFEWLTTKVHRHSIIILDDIYYSPEMEKAWRAIQEHSLVYATADLYRCGIIFFDPSLNKLNVVLQF